MATPSLSLRVLTSYDEVTMITTVSMQDLRNTYDDLKKRVEQLGRFL
jgi:hypothetical protein